MAEDPDNDARRRLGVELRRLRRERGLAQRDLCKSLSLASHTAIVEFESGRRIPSQDILAAYEREFGLVPGSLRQWRRDALAARAASEARQAIGGGAGQAGPARCQPVPRLLPGPAAGFTGRGAELALLDAHLTTESPAPVLLSAISGMGGVGKTALAVHWGHLARHRFPDGDLYIDLRGYHPSGQPMTSSEALGILLWALGTTAGQMPLSAEQRAARFRTLMAGRRMLLVLDNACTADQVRPLLPGSPSCTVLITSRSRLGGLIAREGVRRIAVDVLTPPEARRLLRHIIGPERADAEPGAVAALAELCGYHPLALRISAERVTATRHGTVAGAVEQLSDQFARLDALTTGDDEASAIRAVFTWSYDALEAGQRHLFRLLGLHDGPDISVPAAAALAGYPARRCGELMAGLLGAHLVEEAAAGRYRLHDLLHLFARDRALGDEGEQRRRAASGRVGSWYLHSACAARAALNPHLPPMRPPAPVTDVPPMAFAGRAQALSWYETERANLVAATASAAKHQDLEVAWQLPTALYAYFELRKQYADWMHTHQSAAQAARLLGDREAEGKVLCNLGNAYRPLGRHDEAAGCYTTALALFREVGYRHGEAKVLGNLGSTHNEAGRMDAAVAPHEQAIALFRELGDRHGEALSLANLGRVHASCSRYGEASRCQHRAMELFGAVGDRHGQARVLCNLGMIECRLGRHGPAITLLTRAIADFVTLGDRFEEATTLAELAEAHSARGDTPGARRCLERAHDIFRDLASTQQQDIAARLGDPQPR